MRRPPRVRRRKWYLVSAILVLLIWLAKSHTTAPQVAQGADGNIVRNASFEEPTTGTPPQWTFEPQKVGHKGKVSVVRKNAHSGQFSLKLEPNSNNEPSDLAHNPLGIGQGFPAAPFRGQKVYVSGWLAAEGEGTAVLAVYVVLKNGAVAPLELRHKSNEAGPVLHQDVLVVPDRGDLSYVVVGCMVQGKSGAAYFDDIYVSTRAPIAGAAETIRPDTAGSLNATVEINAAEQTRRIPPEIYGTNLEWIWDGNAMWDTQKDDFNQDVLRLTRELRVSLFRFPGGIFADFYHWQDGIGAHKSRRETLIFPGGTKSRHTFGTDEALAFAEKTGGRLMITVNAVTGTPQEAAAWVRYVNKSGAPSGPRRVEFWEVGNESYVTDGPEHVKAAKLEPDVYARRFVEFARAMRDVDPSIKIGAIGDENFGTVMGRRYPDWTERVLSIAGREMDFLSVHNGYSPAIYTDKGWNVRTVYAAMLASPLLIRSSLDDLAHRIEKLVPNRNIKIAVTEWGPYFQTEPNDRFIDHVKTLGSALFVADAMKVFLESPHTEITNFFKLSDSLWMGWIGPRGNAYIPKAPYFAFQMYTRHFGTTLVPSTAVCPTYDSRSTVGWVDAVSGVPYLDVISSRADDGKTLFVMAINKHFDRSIQAKITLHGFAPTDNGTAWTLQGTGIDANTGTELYKAPGVTWARQAADINPRFDRGDPREIWIDSSPLRTTTPSFEYAFPAHSVTSLEIHRK